MALNNRERERMLAHCGEIHEDDGIDPRQFFKSERTRDKGNHKTHQLCRQVAETIDQVLSGETGDDLLTCLRVDQVRPAPDASRLLVTLHAVVSVEEFCREQLQSRLALQQGKLRATVASAITRKKAPSLACAILGPVSPVQESEQGGIE